MYFATLGNIPKMRSSQTCGSVTCGNSADSRILYSIQSSCHGGDDNDMASISLDDE